MLLSTKVMQKNESKMGVCSKSISGVEHPVSMNNLLEK